MKHIDRWLLNPIPRGATYREWQEFYLYPRILYAHQLLYVFSGNGNGMVNDQRFPLEPGLLVMYGPGCKHSFKTAENQNLEIGMVCFSVNEENPDKRALGNRFVLSVSEDYWKNADEPIQIDGLPPFPFRINISDCTWKRDFEARLKAVGNEWRTNFSDPLVYQVKSLLAFLFYHLELEYKKRQLNETEPPIVTKILQYIESKSATSITRASVARHLAVSESYLASLLQKYRQTNFSNLLESIRLQAACDYLQYSNMDIAQIAEKIGMCSTSYFIARFKKYYNITPGDFRRKG